MGHERHQPAASGHARLPALRLARRRGPHSRPRHADHSRETFDALLDASERIARERFAPFNRLVDVEEPRFDGERVHLPAATLAATRAYAESGLLAAGHDAADGGLQLPYLVDMAANSFFARPASG